jgi:flavorubredoxin
MHQIKNQRDLKTLVIFWSATGNTEKVAGTIRDTLLKNNINPAVKKIADSAAEDLYDYDLVFIGAPSYSFQPPDQVQRYIKDKMKFHLERGDIKIGAPTIPGKTAVIFCTYSGPHTGIREATPVGDYIEQFFEHIGFEVAAKWYIVGEYHGREDMSTQGRLGDIQGRPDRNDLEEVEKQVTGLINSIRSKTK